MLYLTLITSLAIAGVAAYYSIVGLMTIFAGAAFAIAVMGGVLEVGKLVTASWLHQNWKRAPLFMKTYLSSAVVFLMVITSLGIFGFLSKAHVEQMSGTGQAVAQIERVDEKIARLTARIESTKGKITRLETGGVAEVDTRAITVQEEIRNNAWTRIDGQIQQENAQADALRQQLEKDIETQSERIEVARARVREDVEVKERSITRANDRIKQLDSDVRAIADKGVEKGAFGGITKDWTVVASELRQSQEAERASLDKVILDAEEEIRVLRQKEIAVSEEVQKQIETLRTQTADKVKVHLDKIDQLRADTQRQIDDANKEIQRLQSEVGLAAEGVDEQIKALEQNIEMLYNDIDVQREEKFTLESGVRDLEAEVGPLKYVAELIYGDDAKSHFDEAVRWVIILIIVSFDPLAIMLLLAANMGFHDRRNSKMFHDDGTLRVDTDNVVDVDEVLDISNEIPQDEDIEDYEVTDDVVVDGVDDYEYRTPRESKGIKLKVNK